MFYLGMWFLQKQSLIFKEGKDSYCFEELFNHVPSASSFSGIFSKLSELNHYPGTEYIVFHHLIDLISPFPAMNCPLSALCFRPDSLQTIALRLRQGKKKETPNKDTRNRDHVISDLSGGATVHWIKTVLLSVKAAETTKHKLCWWDSCDF